MRNYVIVLCLETISHLAGAPCNDTAKSEYQARSLQWLSLPHGCLAGEIAPCTVRVSSGPGEQGRFLKASIGPYSTKSNGSKDSEMLMLGGGVCCAVGNLINQATNLIFPTELANSASTGIVKSPIDVPSITDECSPHASESADGSAQSSCDVVAEILIVSCSAVESLFASHRRNR